MRRFGLLVGCSAIAMVASATAVYAQQAAAPAADVEEIIVTGSRVIRDGYSQPTPVTVIGADQLTSAQPRSIADALLQLPQVLNSQTRVLCCSPGQSGNYLNLRALGANRTLTLLDGQRVNATTENGVVDSDLLPELLVERVDVVTGGASAAYGSDAISGVINYIVNRKFTGVKGVIQGGMSRYGDDESFKIGVAAGFGFANEKGHFVASAQSYHTGGVGGVHDRPTGRGDWLLGGNGSAAFPWKEYSDTGYMTATFGGLIVNSTNLGVANAGAPLAGLQFLPGAIVAPFNTGVAIPGSPTFCQHCDGADAEISMPVAYIRTNQGYARGEYEFADNLTGFARFNIGDNRNYMRYQNDERLGAQAFTIFSGNPYLPASLQAQMTTGNIASFRLARNSTYDIPIIAKISDVTAWDGQVGVEGTLHEYDWSFAVSHGKTKLHAVDTNDVIIANIYAAADAVRDTSGNIVCRVSITNPGVFPGCVPINLFGIGSPSPAAVDYVTDDNIHEVFNNQTVVAFDVHGDVFALPAGPLSGAAGAEYRRRDLTETSNSIATGKINSTGVRGFPTSICPTPAQCRDGGFNFGNNGTVDAKDSVQEAYVELLAPLLADQPFAKALDLNAAARYTHYTNSGGVSTWKIGATYQPFEDVHLRATRSHDIRAPNLFELFAAPAFGFTPALVDPETKLPQFVVTKTQGNPNLQPEIGNTKSLGVVYSPSWFSGFSGSVDYYDIGIKDGIATYGGQTAADDCFRGDTTACALIVRDPTTRAIQLAINQRVNLQAFKQKGVDVDMSYRTSLEDLSIPGSFTVRLLASHIITNQTISAGVVTDNAGLVSQAGATGAPDWRGTLSMTYDSGGPFSAFVQLRYTDDLFLTPPVANTVFFGDDGKLPAIIYTDLTLRYKVEHFGGQQEMFVTVQNLFDIQPPVAPSRIAAVGYPTPASRYDIVGRYFLAGVRFNF